MLPVHAVQFKAIFTTSIRLFCIVDVGLRKEMVDYIAYYLKHIRSRRVLPDVSPGYMRNLVPDSAPQKGEDWDTIFADIERVIMPGVCLF
ncbi:hypothetical protein CHS0354_037237 [Potamilus streckersoni]|uniref:Uncharacterized protein n=1 Tax=Potamilus streckersoni TaxID=2493646 RepID=A0AAE0SXI9_9BIVA|nr:hypothetical protein CHS0354_037237 [Potamilus streckersoni]